MKEVRVLKADENIPRDMLKVGNILAVSVGTGGLIGRITKVTEPDGAIELSTLAAPGEKATKRLFKDYAELNHIKPVYLAELSPAEESALVPVIDGAWYQDIDSGKVVRATANGWQDESGKTELMPVIPHVILRWDPNRLNVEPAPPIAPEYEPLYAPDDDEGDEEDDN